jgi:hypothetical protein
MIDLASVLEETELEVALDSALRFGPRALKALQAKLNQLRPRGRRGIDTLRELLEAHDGTLDSALEVLVRKLIFAAGLPKPVTQYNVWHQRRWIARVDFAWPKQKLVVQAHGAKWHLNVRRWRIDQRQQTQMNAAAWVPLIVTWNEATKHPARFIESLKEAWQRVLCASNRQAPVSCTQNGTSTSGA